MIRQRQLFESYKLYLYLNREQISRLKRNGEQIIIAQSKTFNL